MAACTVVWFRQDLGVEDNLSLVAVVRASNVIPICKWFLEEQGWLKRSLIHLRKSLSSLGAPLVLR